MSATEIIVAAFGLFVGYWLVAKLLGGATQKMSDERSRDVEIEQPAFQSLPWHEVLEIPPHATVEEIRSAYRNLMSQYHPDKVASLGAELKIVAERKSKEITDAYTQAMRFHEMEP